MADDARRQAVQVMSGIIDLDTVKSDMFGAILVPMLKEFVSGASAELAYNRELLGKLRTPEQFATAYRLIEKQQLEGGPTTAQDFALRYDIDIEALQAEFGEFFQLGLELPDWMVERAFVELAESVAQPYWANVAKTFGDAATVQLERGIERGWSIREIAKELRANTTNPDDSWIKARATNIARTEAGHMLNAGHAATTKQLAEETGLDIRNEWNSALGSTTRDSHAAMHGELSDNNGMFNLSGYMIPWPSHISLPASERCNCQCGITAVPMMDDESGVPEALPAEI